MNHTDFVDYDDKIDVIIHGENEMKEESFEKEKVAMKNGRSMYHAFQRFCSEVAQHTTLDIMNHEARRTRIRLHNAFARLKRKAEKKGIIWLPTQFNHV